MADRWLICARESDGRIVATLRNDDSLALPPNPSGERFFQATEAEFERASAAMREHLNVSPSASLVFNPNADPGSRVTVTDNRRTFRLLEPDGQPLSDNPRIIAQDPSGAPIEFKLEALNAARARDTRFAERVEFAVRGHENVALEFAQGLAVLRISPKTALRVAIATNERYRIDGNVVTFAVLGNLIGG